MPPPQIIGRYEIIGSIGSGGMGTLWRARDPKIGGRTVAIKLLKEGLDNEEIRRRFMQEANAAGVLEHENIVRIFDVGEHHGEPFIAMEFIDGETLSAWIRRREPATLARRLKLIEELCDGLAYAHTFGIVHRDVKPANLMVERRRGRLKILDFGIAKLADSGITNAGALIGSFNYMSPEQVRGLPIDHRSDIFSVGAVLFELISYRQAFPGGLGDGVLGRIAEQPAPLLRQAMEEADPDVEQIIARALSKDANRRYQDLTEMHRELTRARRKLERDDSEEHTVVERATPARPEPTPVPSTPKPTPPRGGRPEGEVQRVAQMRAQRLEEYLAAAERALADGDYEAAIEGSYQASALDEEDSRARDVRERAQAAIDLVQVRQLLGEAREALSRHEVDAAEALVARARELRPDAPEIKDVQSSVIRVRNHTAALAALERARRSLEQRDWTSAIRESADADRYEPGLDEARAIRRQAQSARDEQRRAEAHEQAARHAVVEARKAFAQHQYQAAIGQLEAFAPPHPGVTQEIQRLRTELSAIEERAGRERERQERVRAAVEAARRALAAGAWDEALAACDAAVREGAEKASMSGLRAQIETGRARAQALARQQAQAAALVADARGRFDAGDFKGALARCDAALHLVPDEAAALDLRERAQRALESEQERVRREAHDAAAAQQIDAAGREYAAGRHQEALARLTGFQPPHPRVTAAIEELRRAVAAVEAKAAAAIAWAEDAFRAGDHAAAIDHLSRFEPAGLPAVATRIAALQAERARIDAAAAEARRLEDARRADEEARRAREARAEALLAAARELAEARRFDEALATIADAAKGGPASPALKELDRSVRAAKTEHEAAERLARDLAAKVADAESRIGAGDLAKGLKRVEEVLAADPQHGAALALRARAHELQEVMRRQEEAAKLAAEQERQARDRAAQVAALLKKARKARKPEGAVELLQQALAIEPGHAEAIALLQSHEAATARAAGEQALAKTAETPRYVPPPTPPELPLQPAGEAGRAVPAPQKRPPVPIAVVAAAALVVVLLGGGVAWYVTRPGPEVPVPSGDVKIVGGEVEPRPEPPPDQPGDPAPKPKPEVEPPVDPEPGPATVLAEHPVTIDASPWARVTITAADAGGKSETCVTPCVVRLAEGRYQLAMENGGLSRRHTQSITVGAGRDNRIHVSMPGFSPDRALNSIFGGSSQP